MNLSESYKHRLQELSGIFVESKNDSNKNIVTFLKDQKFVNSRSKVFLYHGTKIPPDKFSLRDDYEWEDSNVYSGDLPDGCLFLTTSISEATGYGKYIIPCELKKYDSITFKVNADNPSVIFDKDYGIDLFKNDKHFGFWDKFENSGKNSLAIQGTNKTTIITYVNNVIPRTDLAEKFYSSLAKTNI